MNKETLLEEMKQAVTDVINGVIPEFKSQFLHPCDVDKFIQDEYKTRSDDCDSNGWQWDYWFYYIINDEKYLLSGSGFYGDLAFSKDEYEE